MIAPAGYVGARQVEALAARLEAACATRDRRAVEALIRTLVDASAAASSMLHEMLEPTGAAGADANAAPVRQRLQAVPGSTAAASTAATPIAPMVAPSATTGRPPAHPTIRESR